MKNNATMIWIYFLRKRLRSKIRTRHALFILVTCGLGFFCFFGRDCESSQINMCPKRAPVNQRDCHPLFKRYHVMEFRETSGRVGNQLFMLATLLATAKQHCYTPLLINFYESLGDVFDIKYFENEHVVDTSRLCWKEFVVDDNIYHEEINTLDMNSNYRLVGFFQSFKYFFHEQELIQSKLVFNKNVSLSVENFLEEKKIENDINICVHVRRGDFLSEFFSGRGYAVADASYLKKAMNYFLELYKGKKINFIYLSNDLGWCKNNTKGDNLYFSPFGEDDSSAGKDLRLMSRCNDVIITGGSFGWMGAWLSGGQVIYYKGYPQPGSWLDSVMVRDDYYPPDWLGMD